MDVIAAVGLGKSYGGVPAVRDLDLAVPEGQVVAILGPNGAGKTTTIEMLLGLRTADAGTVALFGRSPDSRFARARVGSMLQDSDGPANLTVAESVDLVRHYYPYALPVAEILQRADLTAKADSKVGQLSGGQRQRMSFALAISGDPDLLFLDEPTASLDVVARQAFWEQVRTFAALGKTIVFSSHNLAETDAVADRVVVIDHGQVLVDDSPAGVKATVAGKTVRLVTDAEPAEVSALPGVLSVRVDDLATELPGQARLVVSTNQPEEVLRALFAAGRQVADLQVAEADLESAFLSLTRGHEEVTA